MPQTATKGKAFGYKNSTPLSLGTKPKVAAPTVPKIRAFNMTQTKDSLMNSQKGTFTERGSVQIHKINFFESKNSIAYNKSRGKSPGPKNMTARKKVQASNVKYEPAPRRSSRKPDIKQHTFNNSKMPESVQVNLVDEVTDAPINSLKQSLMNPLDMVDEGQKMQTEQKEGKAPVINITANPYNI